MERRIFVVVHLWCGRRNLNHHGRGVVLCVCARQPTHTHKSTENDDQDHSESSFSSQANLDRPRERICENKIESKRV